MCASFCGVLVDASADIPLCLLPVCLSACLSVCLPPREGTTSSICPLISTARPPSAFRSLLYCLCHRLLLFLTLLLPVTLLSACISIIFLSCHTHLPPFFPRLHILPSFFFFFSWSECEEVSALQPSCGSSSSGSKSVGGVFRSNIFAVLKKKRGEEWYVELQ